MRRYPELRPRIWDGLVVLAIAALAVLCAWRTWGRTSSDVLTAVISVDGQEQERTPLETRSWTIEAEGYHLQVEMTDTEIRIASSDCPTQDCVHTGAISKAGQSIVCLPARVSIQLTGGAAEDGVDAVLG